MGTSSRFKFILPASNFERSSISLIKWSNRLVASSADMSNSRCTSCIGSPLSNGSSNNSSILLTPPIGLRISCISIAIKSAFVRSSSTSIFLRRTSERVRTSNSSVSIGFVKYSSAPSKRPCSILKASFLFAVRKITGISALFFDARRRFNVSNPSISGI